MKTSYKPVNNNFKEELETLIAQRSAVRIQYYSEINEFLSVTAMIKDLFVKGEEEYIALATGEEIRLDKIIRVGSKPAPGYDEEYFKCSL